MQENVIQRLNKAEEMFLIGPVVGFFRANLGIICGFIILFLFMVMIADNFFTMANFINILRNVSTNTFLAIGVMLTIMLAGIDLTGGALIALAGCVMVSLLQNYGVPIPVAVACGLTSGLIAGYANGVIIAYTNLHPFVVTLAMMSICRGAAYLVANGRPIAYFSDDLTIIGNGFLGPIPLPTVYMFILIIITYFLLNKTQFGRNIYAVGGNPVAAKFSGVNIHRVKIIVWTISGFLGGFAGIVLSSRMSSGQPSVGLGFETDAIAAAVLGGTSMYGGTGRVGGVFVGALVIGVISNGLNLLHVNSYWQYVAKGVIILVAVMFDEYRGKRQNVRAE